MSDKTPDTTGLREVPDLLAALQRSVDAAKAARAAHPTPDASPDPAVVTPDAGDVETLARLVSHPKPGKVWVQVPHRNDIANDWIEADASDWLASHVAAAREADRAEVDLALEGERQVREARRASALKAEAALAQSESTLAGLRRVHGETMARLAGLVAKIEALADEGICTPGQCCGGYCVADVHDLDRDQAERVRDIFRALIPAGAATALDAVREQAKAEERERIAQAIEAGVLPSHPNEGYKDGFRRAADIARHTPEAT